MAMASIILRRAASSSLLFPRRSLLAATSAVRSSLVVPLSRFSTSSSDVASRIANEDLVRMLKAEIEEFHKKTEPLLPPEFPFVIRSTEWDNTILLSRRYEDEIIKVEVFADEDEVEDEEDKDKDEDDDEEEEEKKKKNDNEDSVTRNFFRVTITKESCNSEIVFEIWAYKEDRITIKSLLVKKDLWGSINSSQLPVFFRELDEETKEGWYKYLDMRGINLTTANSLLAAWDSDDVSVERRKWLGNLKNFMAG